ncbi:MAG: hypothetical protein HYV16_07540 [Gammaproteobacteria bacterium]|nr:hypothetical protein [Gammaproteobacteria bacterium]
MAKPRNPYVAAALLRKAGAHQPTKSGLRFAAKRELARLVAKTDRDGPALILPLAA